MYAMKILRQSEYQSASAQITDTVTGSHDFKIIGYSLNRRLETGKCISSKKFNVGDYLWQIRFYPNGENKENDNASYVAVDLRLVSNAEDVKAVFQIMLLDQSGTQKHNIAETDGPFTFKRQGTAGGLDKFFKQSDLEGSNFLKDDCLHILCNIGVVRSRTESSNKCHIPLPPSDIGQHFGRMLESGKGTDVKFEVDGKTFHAHTLILAARSSVFSAQFFGLFENQNARCIKIEDMESYVFEVLLHFIYRDTLPDVEELNSAHDSITMFRHILAAADRYGLDRLKLLCADKLCDGLSIASAAKTLEVAEKHNCLQLKSACQEFVYSPENLRVIKKTDAFKYLKQNCINVYMNLLEHIAEINEEENTTDKQQELGM